MPQAHHETTGNDGSGSTSLRVKTAVIVPSANVFCTSIASARRTLYETIQRNIPRLEIHRSIVRLISVAVVPFHFHPFLGFKPSYKTMRSRHINAVILKIMPVYFIHNFHFNIFSGFTLDKYNQKRNYIQKKKASSGLTPSKKRRHNKKPSRKTPEGSI